MKKTMTLWALLAVCPLAILAAQTPSPSPKASASPAETMASSTPATPNPAAQSQFVGSWKVERAIYDLYMSLKDVTGSDEGFYTLINLGANGKGKVQYNQKPDLIDVEYDLKEGNLSIAYGSRLKPQVDLYRLVQMNDGTVFLKSQRLAARNGTIYYLLRKTE